MNTHPPQSRCASPPEVRHNYLRDFVYGGIGGTVTTLAVGAAAAGLAYVIGVLLKGVAG